MMYSPKHSLQPAGPVPVVMRCPKCGQNGTFAGYGVNDIRWFEPIGTNQAAAMDAGLRRCPNLACEALVFVIIRSNMLEATFPPELIDFDATALPSPILASLTEAVACQAAGAYRATALMVRRVLEELCADRQATGRDLKARLGNLGQNIVVPIELLDAADELRLLGNDAAHIEAKSYDAIGENEAGLAIDLAKELLKAVYQYASLVDRLKGLRRPQV